MIYNWYLFVVCLVFNSNLNITNHGRGVISYLDLVTVASVLEWTPVARNELEILILQISFTLKEARSLGQLNLGFGVVLSYFCFGSKSNLGGPSNISILGE